MTRFLRPNLHLKIMAALSLTFLPIILFCGVLPLHREREFLLQQDQRRAKDLVRSLQLVAESSLNAAGYEPFRTFMMKTYASDADVLSIRLLDKGQRVLCAVGPRRVLPLEDRFQSSELVYQGATTVGQVELSYSLAGSRAGLDDMSRLVFFTVVDCLLFLGFILHLMLQRQVTRPLSELNRLAGVIANGDLSQRMAEDTADELGAVARSFNHMTTALARSRDDVEQAKRELEDRVRDRTEKLAKEVAKVQRAERLSTVGTLAAGIAHELNNPIGNISTFSQLLLERDQPTPEFLKKGLNTIASETERAGRIIRGLLDFSRQTPAQRVALGLAEVLEATLKIVVPAFTSRASYTVQPSIAPNAPRVSGDAMQLQQVFINILTNAFQAMPGGGQLTVELHAAPQDRSGTAYVVCEITDSGPGILAEDLPRLFDPFFTTKQVGAGTGLGLSVSYGILQEHGGLMEVRSEVGKGATFAVLLPVLEALRT